MYCLPYNRRNFGNCQWPTLQKSCFEKVGVGYRTFEIRDHLTFSPKLVPCPKILNPNRKLIPLIWNSRDEFVWKESSYTRTFAQKTIVKSPMSVLSISYLSPSQEENKNERENEALVLHTCVHCDDAHNTDIRGFANCLLCSSYLPPSVSFPAH